MKISFSRQVYEKILICHFMKIRLVGAELLHADGRTDRETDTMQLMFAFRSFANAPKKLSA